MMWRAPAIVGFAETAGFDPDQLAMACAVALSASGGNDAYVATPWGGSLSRYVGLWQLPVDGQHTRALSALLDPVANARAAHDAFLAAGETWDWCEGYKTGRWQLYLPDAQRAVVAGDRVDTVIPFGALET